MSGTWREWLSDESPSPDDDELITRDELLAIVKDQGVKLSEGDLRFWEQSQVVPKPIKKWHHGATRALYPPTMVRAIHLVKLFQRHGLTLADIRPRIKAFFRDGVDVLKVDPLDVDNATISELHALAALRHQLTGVRTASIEIRLTGADNRTTVYHIDP